MIVALIGGAGPAAAQVLVTNLSEPNDGGYWLGTFDFAQPFTTGTNASGYQLESISIDFLTGRSREYEPVYVYVYGDNGRGGPNHRDQIARPTINGATFEGPVTGVNKYTVRKYGRPAPFNASSVHLDANTQYWVFVWAGEDKTLVNVDDTRSNEETGEPGWSIGDSGLLKPEGSAYSNYIESPTAMKIQVEGYANPEVLISISDATATEGPGVTADFVVTLNRSWSRTITVEYITLFTLSATPGVDYQDRNGTLTFQPGETSKIISVPIIDDTVPDSGETFELLLYDAKGADIADETGIGTILNTEILTGSFDNVPGEHDGLTGSFEGVPEAHDGQSAFSFRVAFSEDIGISYKTLRDESFTTTGGAVTGARRVDGRNDLWEITVKPSDAENVTITLPRRDCGTTGAVCTREDTPRALTNSPSATVAGPPSEPLTASFSGVPVSHDGQHAFTFGLTFSEDVAGLSYKTLRDVAFSETNGQVTQARRKQQGSNQSWTITVKPDTSGAVTIRLPATTDCEAYDAICTSDDRPLSNSPSATIPGQAALDFAHFAKGATITSEMVLVNAAPHPSRPAIYFYDTKGDPIPAESVVDLTGDLEVTEDGGLTVWTEMEPLEALTISTHGRGEPVSGSVKVLSDGPIGGVVRYSVPEIRVAGVGPGQPTSDALFPVRRQAGGIRTAAALHNLEAEAMGVRCRLMSGGVALEEVEIHLEANGQASWFIEDAFTATDTSDFRGSVRCTAPGNGRFTAVALEMDASNRIFTTLPVVPVDPPGSGNQQTTLDFAHFANGIGITSEMVFLNPSTQPSRPAVYFYDTEGNPIAAESVVDITGDLEITEDGGLTIRTEIEPLGVLTISTHGRGELVTGSVRVVSDGPIGGLLRFEHPGVGAGVVGASPPISDAIFPVRRQEGGINTWVALHNLESSAGLVHCDLMWEGVLLDGASIPLEANGQTAWLIDQAFPDTDTSDFAGSVRCSAPGGDLFTAVALEMDPGTRIFTTLPVVPVPERTDRE